VGKVLLLPTFLIKKVVGKQKDVCPPYLATLTCTPPGESWNGGQAVRELLKSDIMPPACPPYQACPPPGESWNGGQAVRELLKSDIMPPACPPYQANFFLALKRHSKRNSLKNQLFIDLNAQKSILVKSNHIKNLIVEFQQLLMLYDSNYQVKRPKIVFL
jgi:hypothetical protein